MKGLTDRQREVLAFIADRIEASGYPPTIREIGNGLQIRSTNGVNDHLKALEKKGYIERDTSKSRAIQITARAGSELGLGATAAGPNTDGLAIPLLGDIAAGEPIEALETSDEHIVIDPSLLGRLGSADVFALRVQGESMIGDGIFDGDLIFVKQQSEARRGELVAVWMDGGATVKRYYRDGDVVRLEPSNPSMKPLFVHANDADGAKVVGKVVGVYRQLG